MTTLTLRSLRNNPLRHHTFSSSLLLRHQQTQLSLSSITLLSQKRHASSTTTSTTSTRPSTPHSKVNGPISTLPAPLETPERQPGQSFFPSYAFALGKSYLKFYKNGLKAIYTNFLACRPIQAKLDNKYNGSLAKAIDAGFLDRSSFQLLTRSWFDVKRIPLFALVFLICGEFTPLVVIAVTSVVPYTCRIPKQIESDRKTLEKRRAISFRNLTTVLPKNNAGVVDLVRMQLLHINWSLGLSSSAWDWLGGRLPGLPTPFLRRKVRRRVQYLEWDDKLIRRDGGIEGMSIEEVRMALIERGVDVLEKSESQLRAALKAWMRARDKASILRLLLTR
jgi:hypothetical protein